MSLASHFAFLSSSSLALFYYFHSLINFSVSRGNYFIAIINNQNHLRETQLLLHYFQFFYSRDTESQALNLDYYATLSQKKSRIFPVSSVISLLLFFPLHIQKFLLCSFDSSCSLKLPQVGKRNSTQKNSSSE